MAAAGTTVLLFRTSNSKRAFTNWLGQRALSLLSNTALSFPVPVVWSIFPYWVPVSASAPFCRISWMMIAMLWPVPVWMMLQASFAVGVAVLFSTQMAKLL